MRVKICKSDRKTSKGAIMSSIAFLVLISLLSLVYMYSSSSTKLRSLVAQDLISNRIYYNFQTINYATRRIIEEELGGVANPLNKLNVTIDEQPDYSYVTFTERLPQAVANLNEDLLRYEEFVETYLPEGNIEIDTSIAGLGGSMTLVIEPYNIVYTHNQFGQRQYYVIPENTEDSLGKLNSYNLTIQLIEGWNITYEGNWGWGPLKSGDLRVTILTMDEAGSSYETTEYISRSMGSQFKINAIKGGFEGYVRARFNFDGPGVLTVEAHLTESIVSTELNLTDVPGRTWVDLVDGKINVIETLYYIEKNDTVQLD